MAADGALFGRVPLQGLPGAAFTRRRRLGLSLALARARRPAEQARLNGRPGGQPRPDGQPGPLRPGAVAADWAEVASQEDENYVEPLDDSIVLMGPQTTVDILHQPEAIYGEVLTAPLLACALGSELYDAYLAFHFDWRDAICQIGPRYPVGEPSPREVDDIVGTLADSLTDRYTDDSTCDYVMPQNGSDD